MFGPELIMRSSQQYIERLADKREKHLFKCRWHKMSKIVHCDAPGRENYLSLDDTGSFHAAFLRSQFSGL